MGLRLEGFFLSAKPIHFGLLGCQRRLIGFLLCKENTLSLRRGGAADRLVAAAGFVVLEFAGLLRHPFLQFHHAVIRDEGETAGTLRVVAKVHPGGGCFSPSLNMHGRFPWQGTFHGKGVSFGRRDEYWGLLICTDVGVPPCGGTTGHRRPLLLRGAGPLRTSVELSEVILSRDILERGRARC